MSPLIIERCRRSNVFKITNKSSLYPSETIHIDIGEFIVEMNKVISEIREDDHYYEYIGRHILDGYIKKSEVLALLSNENPDSRINLAIQDGLPILKILQVISEEVAALGEK